MKLKKWIIPLNAVPETMTVAQYIWAKTDLERVISQFPRPRESVLKLKIEFDLVALKADLLELLDEFPAYSYPYGVAPATPFYRMIYLNYNPNSRSSQFAYPVPTAKDSYSPESILGVNVGKNSHNDTLSIFTRTDIAKAKSLGKFLDGFRRTLIRSRLILHSGLMANDPVRSELSWHTDEKIFINTRLNVPVLSTDNFAIEYLRDGPLGEEIGSFDLLEGTAFCHDTGRPHRFLSKRPLEQTRVGLICGFCPWFDFDAESNSWVSNQFYGELHPFEIVKQGYANIFLRYEAENNELDGNAETHSYHSVT